MSGLLREMFVATPSLPKPMRAPASEGLPKGEGFDVKILKEIIKLRKQDQEERDERVDLYMRAMQQAGPEKVAKAA